MAMTAVCTISSATCLAGPPGVMVYVTVSNSLATAVTVLSCKPYVYRSGAQQSHESASFNAPLLTTGNNSVVTGTPLVLSFPVVFDNPQAKGLAGSHYTTADNSLTQAYDVGAEVNCADGTVIYATVVTCTVSEPSRS